MQPGRDTLYQVLGVSRNAKVTDITRAYARIRSELQKENVAPNPRLAAMAKVAYETLSDPDKREAYDKTLPLIAIPAAKPRPRARGKSRAGVAAAVVLLGLLAAGGGWYFLEHRPGARSAQRPAEKALSGSEIAEAVSPYLGRVQGSLMSGETRELGLALAMGENEMVTTCRGISAGLVLSVTVGTVASKAELARAHEDLDVCVLAVRGPASGIKARPGPPPAKETLQAIVVAATGLARPLQVAVARRLEDAKGPVIEIKAGAALPNGTPLFDAQGRLVGLVTAPHAYGEGLVAALGAARLAQAHAPAQVAAAPEGIPAEARAAAPADPAPASAPQGTLVSEGFTTLWKEDEGDHRLVEVLDDVSRGDVGIPIAYWTLWRGRDSVRRHPTQCVVTYGPEDELVTAYEQETELHPADGYWFCALTRFQVDLDDLPVGDYRFMIFVDGEGVAESSIRIEKRFFTRGRIAVIVIVVGLGLLALVRRKA